MRTFLLICFVALAVAIGMGFVVGFFALDTEHLDGKCTVTLTVNTRMISDAASRTSAPTEQVSADIELLDVKGKITAVQPEKNEFVISENIKNWRFQLAKGGQVLVNERPSTLSDLRAGDDATVTFERQGQQLIASVVRSTRK
jgi:hypothetical protein